MQGSPSRTYLLCILTFCALMQVGDVLVGNSRSRSFEFVNQGGAGRFMLLPAKAWAAAVQQHKGQTHHGLPQQQQSTDVSEDGNDATALATGSSSSSNKATFLTQATCDEPPESVTSGPFTVHPAYLDLPPGAAGCLMVDFSPTRVGPHVEGFVLVCDNCTAHPLQVEGCGAEVQVQLVGLDDRPWLQQDSQAPLWLGQVSKCWGVSRSLLWLLGSCRAWKVPTKILF